MSLRYGTRTVTLRLCVFVFVGWSMEPRLASTIITLKFAQLFTQCKLRVLLQYYSSYCSSIYLSIDSRPFPLHHSRIFLSGDEDNKGIDVFLDALAKLNADLVQKCEALMRKSKRPRAPRDFDAY